MSEVETKPKPGGWAYILPIAILVVGGAFAIYLLVAGIQRRNDVIDNFARFDTGSTATVELKAKGTYTVWVELPSTSSDARNVSTPSTNVLVKDPQDKVVTVQEADEAFDTYGDGGRKGIAVHEFKAAEPGQYKIGAVYNGSGPARFAIGRDNPNGEAGKGVGLFFLVGLISFILFLIVLIVIMVMRGRSKRRIRAARLGQGGPYAGGYATPGYGAPGYGAPTYGAPTYGAPTYSGPTTYAPGAYDSPRYGTPGYGEQPAPGYGEPPVPVYEPPAPGYAEPPPSGGGGTPAFGGEPGAVPAAPPESNAPPPPPGWGEGPPPSP